MEDKLKTGTTTVGIKTKDAVVLAADMKATLGNVASELNATKLYKISDRIGVAIAGSFGDCLTVVRFLKSQTALYNIERETNMSANAAITFLSNILNSNRYFPFLSFFIMGGYNSKPDLFTTDMVGGSSEVDKFTAVGSGFQLALGVLEEGWKEGMSEEETIKLAVNAIKVARKRDIYTGGEGIKLIVIDKNGIRELEKEVEKYA